MHPVAVTGTSCQQGSGSVPTFLKPAEVSFTSDPLARAGRDGVGKARAMWPTSVNGSEAHLLRYSIATSSYDPKQPPIALNELQYILPGPHSEQAITMPTAIALCKFVGTISLGLLTVRLRLKST